MIHRLVPIFFATLLGASILVIGLIGGVGKGNRCAPCDALVADIAPPKLRGAAFGLRQSLDTVGAVVWCVVIPGAMAVALLAFGVKKS